MSHERTVLLLESHRIIHAISEHATDSLGTPVTAPAVVYPPNGALSPEEVSALQTLALSDLARAALRKLVANACAEAFFEFFALIDGVADPATLHAEPWLGARIVPASESDEHEEMWHDDFFDSYWNYRRRLTSPEATGE